MDSAADSSLLNHQEENGVWCEEPRFPYQLRGLGKDRAGFKISRSTYLQRNPGRLTYIFPSISFDVKGDNDTSRSYLQVVLKVKADDMSETHCTLRGTTQMSSYFRHEAVYEKCGCPGSPSKSQEGERGWSRAGKGGACAQKG